MGKIRDTLIYPVKELPVLEDYLIGSDSETGNKRTVNFSLLKIKELLAAGRLLNGTVDPVDGDGSIGDFYINTATWQIFGPKAAGVWPSGTDIVGPAGDDGDDGSDGKTILNGTGDPTSEGVDGDFYINTATWQIFGPKDPATGWGVPIDLVGADGEDGASSYTAIAYADDDLGTGFTMSFDPDKDYIAIKTSASPIPENPAQFADLWKYYAGGSAPAVETAPEGLYTCDTSGSFGVHLVTSGVEYTLPLNQVIGDGLALGEYEDSVVVDSDKALFYRCLHNICGNITPDKACTITLKLYQDDVLQRSRSIKVFDMGGGFAPVLAVLNYITENVTGSTKIKLTLSADIDDVWAAVEDLNHNMTFRQYTPNPEDELPEGAFLDEEGRAFIDEEGSFFIDGE